MQSRRRESRVDADLSSPPATKTFDTPYPPIDTDPHFRRVVGNFRQSDYVAWAGATAAFPSSIYLMGALSFTLALTHSLISHIDDALVLNRDV